MRRYDIVFAILLIFSIIDFALAAPVLVQEKRHAYVDVVNIPKDMSTVLTKRGEYDLARLAEEYLKTWGKPIDSSNTHALSSSAQPVPDHESTNVEKASAPNPASSTANPDSLMEPPGQSWAVSIPGDRHKEPWDDEYPSEGEYNPLDPKFIPGSPGHGSDNKWTWAKAQKPEPIPIPRPSTDADEEFDWEHWANVESPPRQKPEPEPETISIPRPSTDADAEFDWEYWMTAVSPPRQKSPPKETSLAPEYQYPRPSSEDPLVPVPKPALPNSRLSTELDSYGNLMAAHQPSSPLSPVESDKDHNMNPQLPDRPPPIRIYSSSYQGSSSPPEKIYSSSYPGSPSPPPRPTPTSHSDPVTPIPGSPEQSEDEVDDEPPPSPALTDPELHVDHPSLSTGSQPVNILEALSALKGKAKDSDTARDVGNAAQEL